jgi:hypothetical protein
MTRRFSKEEPGRNICQGFAAPTAIVSRAVLYADVDV